MSLVPAVMRSLLAEPRPLGAPHRVWRDWALVAVVLVLCVLEGLRRDDLAAPWVHVAVTMAVVPTLLWRRRRPLAMLLVAIGADLVLGVVGAISGATATLDAAAFILVLVYALGRWGSGREVVVGVAILLLRIALSVGLGVLSVAEAAGGVAVVAAAVATGVAVRTSVGARAREVDRGRVLERERLSRDLHDTVAHHVSAIAVRAQAGIAAAPHDDTAAVEALRVVEEEARRALAEMRTVVRVLRHGEAVTLSPGPSVRDVEQLARAGPGGPDVEVSLEGPVDTVAEPLGTVVYRLAQESVTNALRHARHATRVRVRVAVDPTSVHLRVSDDGARQRGTAVPVDGFGLAGMKERADLLGGRFEAGPDPGGGWTVSAVLPREPAR